MTSTSLTHHANKFRLAVESRDFSLAQTALREYVACFRSCSRTAHEVADARKLLQWGIQATKAHKAQMAEELMLLKRVFDAYRPARLAHTWRLEG
jgi:hypothetical protein